jgi:hypothetical protein
MARKILCPECGVIKPTHPEDAARGLFQKWVRGTAHRQMVCDCCDETITVGDICVAWSQPAEVSGWEPEYIDVAPSQPISPRAAWPFPERKP